MQPDIIVFCAFTRAWAVDRWIENLASLKLDPRHTSFCAIIDLDEPIIEAKLRKFYQRHGFKKLLIKMNTESHPNEVRIAVRRLRIAEVKNQSKELIAQCEGEYILAFEDDTVFEGLDWHRLVDPLRTDQVGFVQGVQCGRWGVKMIGAWKVDDRYNPKKIETLLPGKGYQAIDAGGWYGYATRRSLYLNCEYYTSTAQPWGPDVNYGLWLRNQGYKSLIDWDSVFGHNDHNVILYPDENLSTITFEKDVTKGKWSRHDKDLRAG